ncbi:outer membrane protein assembly factor BamB family protein [Streptomyces sp. NPDC055722]
MGELAGRILAGRYELGRLLGRGGMGEVWAAHDAVIRRQVAIKLIQHQPDGDDGTELFFREARTAGGLSHPAVVTVYDLGQDTDGTLYLVMELLAGRDLSVVLRQDGPPTITDAVDWTAQTADALAAAHAAGIVHRDLKPANLMLTPTGTIKILDFGIARYASTVTHASRIIGTPAYMPPERLLGKVGDGRGDLYSLGCLLHQLLTGATPFGDLDTAGLMYAHLHRDPEPPSTRRPGIPVALDRLVLDLLAKDPEHRPATAAHVRDRLRTVTTAPTPAEPTATTQPHRPRTPQPVPAHQSRTVKDSAPGPSAPAESPLPATLLESPAASNRTAHPDPAPDRQGIVPNHATPSAAQVVSNWRSPAPVHAEPADTPNRQSSAPDRTPATLHAASAPHSAPPRRRALWLGIAIALVATGSITARVIISDPGSPSLEPAWTYTTGDRWTNTPAVADGTVYISSSGNKVYALGAATGTKKWVYAAGGDKVACAPAVADGIVYFGSRDGRVYALDAATGTKKWTYTIGGPVASTPVVADGTVYIGGDDDRVYALNAATGTKKWTYTTGGEVWSNAAVSNGTVYVGSLDGKVYALNAATGTKKWTYATSDKVAASPKVANGTVYINSNDGNLYALNAATGTRKWAYPTGGGENGAYATPRVVDGTVYVSSGGEDGEVYALDAATGTQKWAHTSGHFIPTPAVVDGTVYVSSPDGKVDALDAATGTRKWTYTTGGKVPTSPTVADGTVYMGSQDGKVYALDAATGAGPAD